MYLNDLDADSLLVTLSPPATTNIEQGITTNYFQAYNSTVIRTNKAVQ